MAGDSDSLLAKAIGLNASASRSAKIGGINVTDGLSNYRTRETPIRRFSRADRCSGQLRGKGTVIPTYMLTVGFYENGESSDDSYRILRRNVLLYRLLLMYVAVLQGCVVVTSWRDSAL
jgi:hypothetical protein